MGRFSLVVEKADIRRSTVGAASIVSLLLQGVSAEKRRSNAAFSSQSFSSLSTLLPMPETAFGNGVAGFVTIGDYVFYQGEKPLRGFAAMRLTASKTSHAGKRADEVDAQAMNALAGERQAGCDAGKGVIELTAGSLAKGIYLQATWA